jgi:hypothetical protein
MAEKPLFLLTWIADMPPHRPEQLEIGQDPLLALVHAAMPDSRAFDRRTGIWAWQGTGWRLRDILLFAVDVDTDQPERATEWFLSKGYPDEDNPKGYLYVFLQEDGQEHRLFSPKPMSGLTVLDFAGNLWLLAERWAINLNKVVRYHLIYGSMNSFYNEKTAD